MLRNSTVSFSAGAWSRGSRLLSAGSTFFITIRGRILTAFIVMSVITGTLGYCATLGIRHAGILVDKTFDESLMSINYARAAATDFAAMRAAFARQWIETDPKVQKSLDADIQKLRETLRADLQVALERSQSPRAKTAAINVQHAANAWLNIRERLLDNTKLDVNWETLDRYAAKVDEQIDLLVNYTAGDGFIYRQKARATVARDVQLNVAGTILALILSALVAWALARRIVGPVAVASGVAERIAMGKLDVVVPGGSADELGALLSSMSLMRDNIKAMMDREVAQRRSAQARLADALECSQDGVLVVDADDCIVLANAQAANFLGLPPESLKRGTPLAEVRSSLKETIAVDKILVGNGDGAHGATDIQLADSRWLRISRSPTRDDGFIVLCSDVTRSKMQEASLQETNLLLDAALENMSQGLCLYDRASRLEVVNRRFFEIFDLPADRIKAGMSFREILELSTERGNHPGQTVEHLLAEQMKFLKKQNGPHFYELSNGRVVSCHYRSAADGRWVATYEDVTERHRAEAKIMHMARHDALTGLPNRLLFRDKMEQALGRGERFALLFLDLDRFKSVNDTLGHPIGDALLIAVTDRLQAVVKGRATVARLGGDEFAVVQLGGDADDATTLAGRIIDTLTEPFEILGHQVVIGSSIGIALAPTDGREPDQLLRNADMALYRAKSGGRCTYHFFHPDMDTQVQARRTLELDLRQALAMSQFELYYQPIVDIAGGHVAGFEALIRWNHPERGFIEPSDFIPAAEEIGLITALGDWVIRKACLEAATWPENLTVAVNLSAAQFRSPMLALSVVSALGASGLSPRRLELEITEGVLLQDNRAVLETLHQLRQLGVRICMDDFGTGYSSLSYLRSFPFDKIKIDRSFISELGKENDSLAIIRAVTRLGNGLGMITTAEGVETEEQLEILRAEGCTQVQGYLFSRARPASEVPNLLKTIRPRIRAA
jgi:diguanylate cyclase (GGDEF)-like protein